MKPEELRIGNIISVYGIPEVVTGSLIARLEEITNKGKIAIDLSPIAITEELLIEKCGFKKSDSDVHNISIWEKNHFLLNSYKNDLSSGIWMRYYYGRTQKKYKYIHELQNISYWLTGEELTINL